MHVLKVGGNELDDPSFLNSLALALADLDGSFVVVHGGGKAIANMQERLGLRTTKVDGLRVTDAESLSVAQMVLSGQSNKRIVSALLKVGVDALGLSGVDRGLLRCKKKHHPTIDLGFVGEIVQVRVEVVEQLLAEQVTPVVSPISLGLDGEQYNVNADEVAGALALALSADLLDFVSDVSGVIQDGVVVPELTQEQAEALVKSGVIRNGMVPKVQAAINAIDQGVRKVRIVDLAGVFGESGTVFLSRHSFHDH